jgi:hypothetical protein
MTDYIETPKGAISITPAGKAKLVWNTNFQPERNKQYSDAQNFIDSEVLRLCEPYIPLLTGMLIMSGILGTDVGSGLVQWIAPYASSQYYRGGKPGSQTGPLRGPAWFERMKSAHVSGIIEGSRRFAGGG